MDTSDEQRIEKERECYATFCEADDMLRVYVFSPLPNRTGERLRKAGFEWFPDLYQYLAEGWSASRELLLVRLFGEMGDDSTNLVDGRQRNASQDRSDRAIVEHQRQQLKIVQAEKLLALWQEPELSRWQMLFLANFNHASYRFPKEHRAQADRKRSLIGPIDIWSALQYGVIDEAQAKQLAIASYRSSMECSRRWMEAYGKASQRPSNR